jgi:hypothetical protein
MMVLSMMGLVKPALPKHAMPKPALAKIGLPPNWRSRRRHQAFTLIEMVVTVAVLGIVSAVVFTSSDYFLRRDRANAAVNELAGWLEAMSAKAGSVGPCWWVVRRGGLEPGTPFAYSSGAGCTERTNLMLPVIDGARYYLVTAEFPNGDWVSFIDPKAWMAFSPRSGVVADGKDIIIKVAVNGEPPMRCVRISFGSIITGINNATGDADNNTCTVWQQS